MSTDAALRDRPEARRDLSWLWLAAVFALALALTWQRWGNPLVDCGREMNQPLRILNGEKLYTEVGHIYGPLAPYLNALLYALFGVSLGVLYASGIAWALLILALTHLVARRLLSRGAAAAATLTVMWLCAFKPSGNYIMPYAFAALYGCGLGLGALVASLRFLQCGRVLWLSGAGFLAGGALLAKAELGLAAAATGLVVCALNPPAVRSRARSRLAGFLLPLLAAVVLGYGLLAGAIGWRALVLADLFLPGHLPDPLVYYNRRMFGFDDPGRSLVRMTAIAARISLVVSALAAVAYRLALNRRSAEARRPALARTRRRILVAAVVSAVLTAFITPRADWDKGPFLAVPFLLVGLVLLYGWRILRRRTRARRPSLREATLFALAVFALASLLRTALRVRSGGAYSSYLLPMAVVLFTFGLTHLLPALMGPDVVRRATKRLAVGLLLFWALGTAAITLHRYRLHFKYPLRSARGTMRVLQGQGAAFDEAMQFVRRASPVDSTLAVLPEGTALQFLTARRNPLVEEIATPGLLDEERAIRSLAIDRTPIVMITNRATVEFGAAVFGRDYDQRLMAWLGAHYRQCGLFPAGVEPEISIGDPRFFIRAYCLASDSSRVQDGNDGADSRVAD